MEVPAMIDHAIYYRITHGFSIFPLQPSGKRPLFDWDRFKQLPASLPEIRRWNPRWNLALATGHISGVVVVDCESPEDAEWFLANRKQTPLRVRTPRGFHLYFRHPGGGITFPNSAKVPDETGRPRYDVRGDGGYVLLPPSEVSDTVPGVKQSGQYELAAGDFRLLDELPFFDDSLQRRGQTYTQGRSTADSRKVSDGVAYIQQIQAVSGQNGHNKTFRAVCRLKDSGMDAAEATAVMMEWNQTNAEPPWTMQELLHKIRSVYGDQP